ncbi:MAG: ribosome biogenesis GTPase Der [Dehalococcoidia bacterium]|nr:MAG: ribosome biogenesis GTPase Der [Dehalococcoidia bacterium]
MTKPIVAIVGRPNVGKSTLFNRLVGKRLAIIEDEPGTTRDRLYADIAWRDSSLTLIDTGGLFPIPPSELAQRVKEQVEVAIVEADVIIFLVDVVDGGTIMDKEIAEMLRRSDKPVMLAANKADNERRQSEALQFYELALGDPQPISAYHDIGIDELLDKVVDNLPFSPPEEELEMMKVAIVGRPNVGKSMLLNAILGQERAIVTDTPGTTRDAIDTIFEYNGDCMLLIDTAGIRRRGRIEGGIERYSVARALRAIGRADVALLITEATGAITAQDAHIAGYIQQAFKGMVLVVNKWDLVEEMADRRQYATEIQQKLKFMPYVPILFVSAKFGRGVENVLTAAREVFEERGKRVPTPLLNTVIRDAVAAHAPPSVGGKRLKILYATQAEKSPPTFVFFVNDASLMHFSYQRYLENRLRQSFGFQGTPLRLIFKRRGEA